MSRGVTDQERLENLVDALFGRISATRLGAALYGVCWGMASDAAEWDWHGSESSDDVQRRVNRWKDPDGRDPWWRYSREFPLWVLEQCKPGRLLP